MDYQRRGDRSTRGRLGCLSLRPLATEPPRWCGFVVKCPYKVNGQQDELPAVLSVAAMMALGKTARRFYSGPFLHSSPTPRDGNRQPERGEIYAGGLSLKCSNPDTREQWDRRQHPREAGRTMAVHAVHRCRS